MRTRSLNGTPLTPCSQTFLFSWGSRRTSEVPYSIMVSAKSKFFPRAVRPNQPSATKHNNWVASVAFPIFSGNRRSLSSGEGCVSAVGKVMSAYHRLVRESLDLLDGAGSSLLEGHTVHLFKDEIRQHVCIRTQKQLHHGMASSRLVRRTLLWRWMVYSRATTSEMAERPCLPVFLVDDISKISTELR